MSNEEFVKLQTEKQKCIYVRPSKVSGVEEVSDDGEVPVVKLYIDGREILINGNLAGIMQLLGHWGN